MIIQCHPKLKIFGNKQTAKQFYNLLFIQKNSMVSRSKQTLSAWHPKGIQKMAAKNASRFIKSLLLTFLTRPNDHPVLANWQFCWRGWVNGISHCCLWRLGLISHGSKFLFYTLQQSLWKESCSQLRNTLEYCGFCILWCLQISGPFAKKNPLSFQKYFRKFPESSRKLPAKCHKTAIKLFVARKLPEWSQKMARKLQTIARKLPKCCHKVARKWPERC